MSNFEISIKDFKNLSNAEDYEVWDEEIGEWVSFSHSCYNKSTGGGFPKPEKAEHPVTAIALHDSVLNKYFIWTLSDYDPSKSEHDVEIEHVKFRTEEALLKQLIAFWSDEFTCPDVITGWNIRGFDVPYLVNRIKRLLGEDYAKKLSPWGLIEQRQISVMKKPVQVYDLVGIAQLDFQDLFKKFGYTFGPQENYRLDTIANTVLGERKMSYDEYGTLTNLYKENSQLYNDYCLKDTILVVRMENKIALITLALTMAYRAGVNYSDTMGTTAIWDQLIHRYLMKDKIVVPPSYSRMKDEFEGAYVKDPQTGVHNWVCSFDVNSMHPSLIVQLNMSPETLLKGEIEHGMNVERMLAGYVNNTEYAMSATGQYFSKHKQGVLPKLVEELYAERVNLKAKMKEQKQLLEKLKEELAELEKE